MFLRLRRRIIATAREVDQEIAQAPSAFSGKGTLVGLAQKEL
jgi:hypothetical protein